MPGWVRLGDLNDAGAAIIANTARTVIVNGKPAALVGSIIAPHLPPFPPTPPHVGQTVVIGSPSVFVEGLPPAYVGSLDSCLHKQVQGSINVFIPPPKV